MRVFALRDTATGFYLSASNRQSRLRKGFNAIDQPRLFPSRRSAMMALNAWKKLLGFGTWCRCDIPSAVLLKERAKRASIVVEVVEFTLLELASK